MFLTFGARIHNYSVFTNNLLLQVLKLIRITSAFFDSDAYSIASLKRLSLKQDWYQTVLSKIYDFLLNL